MPKRVVLDKNNKRTISHELTHTAGFKHPEDEPGGIVQGANKFDQRFDSNLTLGHPKPHRIRLFDTQYNYLYENRSRINKQTQFRNEGGKRKINWTMRGR